MGLNDPNRISVWISRLSLIDGEKLSSPGGLQNRRWKYLLLRHPDIPSSWILSSFILLQNGSPRRTSYCISDNIMKWNFSRISSVRWTLTFLALEFAFVIPPSTAKTFLQVFSCRWTGTKASWKQLKSDPEPYRIRAYVEISSFPTWTITLIIHLFLSWESVPTNIFSLSSSEVAGVSSGIWWLPWKALNSKAWILVARQFSSERRYYNF